MYSRYSYSSADVFQVAVSGNAYACFPYFLMFSLIHAFLVFDTLVVICYFLLIIVIF